MGTYVLVLVVQVFNLVYFSYSTYLSVIAASVVFDHERYNIRFRIHVCRILATLFRTESCLGYTNIEALYTS